MFVGFGLAGLLGWTHDDDDISAALRRAGIYGRVMGVMATALGVVLAYLFRQVYVAVQLQRRMDQVNARCDAKFMELAALRKQIESER
jgi:hypothetical protein